MSDAIPDSEKLVIDYLLAVDDVTDLVGTNIGPALPEQPAWPWLTVSRVGGTPSLPGYLDNPRLEFTSWAATKGAARAAAGAARAAMVAITGSHDLGVVTGAFETGDGLRWDPDDVANIPRYRFEFDLYIHPAVTP